MDSPSLNVKLIWKSGRALELPLELLFNSTTFMLSW